MNLHWNRNEFQQLISQAANFYNTSSAIIEKDYYVTLFLQELVSRNLKLVFKGGTSLSKCFHLIHRYSEDLDLSCCTSLTIGERRKVKADIQCIAEQYGLIIANIQDIRSRRAFNAYQIEYPSVFSDAALKHGIAVETAFQTAAFPCEVKPAVSLLADFLNKNGFEDFAMQHGLTLFTVTVQSLARTLIDKLFAICDYAISGKISEHSRHLYDICKLKSVVQLDQSFLMLFAQVRCIRQNLPMCYSAKNHIQFSQLLLDVMRTDLYQNDYLFNTIPLCWGMISYAQTKRTLLEIADYLLAHSF